MPVNQCDVFRCNGARDDIRQIEADNTVSLRVGARHEIAADFGPLLKGTKEIAAIVSIDEWNSTTPVSIPGSQRIIDNDRTDQLNSMVAWTVRDAVFGETPTVRIIVQNDIGGVRALNGHICIEE